MKASVHPGAFSGVSNPDDKIFILSKYSNLPIYIFNTKTNETKLGSIKDIKSIKDAGDGADDVAAVARPYDQQQQEDVHHDGLHTDGQVEASSVGQGVEHRGQAGHAARSQAVGHLEAVNAHGKDRRAQDD